MATHEGLVTLEEDVAHMKAKIDKGLSSEEIEKVKAALLPDLENTFCSKLASQIDKAHKIRLAQEVWEHEHGLIIHGLNANGTIEDAVNELFGGGD